MRTVWFCEQDEFCQRVLAKHWPGVPCHPDVRALVADTAVDGRGPGRTGRPDPDGAGEQQPALQAGLSVPVPYVDVLAGGFPCQDLSYAGKGAGIDGERSGLWGEYARLIRELRPRYVVVENVTALLARGMGRVLGDLAACGYDAEWDCIPAAAVGAPHRRDRVWIVAYPNGAGLEGHRGPDRRPGELAAAARRGPDRTCIYCGRSTDDGSDEHEECFQRSAAENVADADAGRRDPRCRPIGARVQPRPESQDAGWWSVEPGVGRVAHGVPQRVDRLRSLGNALVPQIAEWLGHQILQHERTTP
jgi:DNA (cytosine-5)-methyltransferase 1